ncbi:LL-diaminopimelate aminotransferase [Nostoc commune]|uniref:LL-diaminopimelate aminotransferase n=1 Tax=Nostoc commune TaxID=1178 RepID=UPI0018C70AB7|nr:LL-diaminopimelate aminotransferase [Nostoc commune]MBG1264602.1 aminotransferase class I/II-fold pyridoxal phosphate-dependent enzyme [Nostoc commune BAE]
MKIASRLNKISTYLLTEINSKKQKLIDEGKDVIDLCFGAPDYATSAHIVAAMHRAIDDPSTHKYPPYMGIKEYRKSAADWMKRRFEVEVDSDTEVIASIGSKEAIHNLYLAFVEPGDYVLIPDPGYPTYRTSTILLGAEYYPMPLLAENGFLPNLLDIPTEVAQKATLLWVNYPHNPTGAVTSLEFFTELVEFGKKYEILICHDHAYSEITYGSYASPSILQVPGAKDIAIEFHSCSKSYNMAGWRVGFVTGNKTAIKSLGKVKSNIDSGVFEAIQRAAVAGFATPKADLQQLMSVYQERGNVIVNGLRYLGWPLKPPKATLYVWAPVPLGYTSTEFAALLLDKCMIFVAPGNVYGEAGEGFFRIALTVPKEQMQKAIERMEVNGIYYNKKN